MVCQALLDYSLSNFCREIYVTNKQLSMKKKRRLYVYIESPVGNLTDHQAELLRYKYPRLSTRVSLCNNGHTYNAFHSTIVRYL